MKTPLKGTKEYGTLVARLSDEKAAKLNPKSKPEARAEDTVGPKELFRKRAADNIAKLKI
jgi:hypothetical protein